MTFCHTLVATSHAVNNQIDRYCLGAIHIYYFYRVKGLQNPMGGQFMAIPLLITKNKFIAFTVG